MWFTDEMDFDKHELTRVRSHADEIKCKCLPASGNLFTSWWVGLITCIRWLVDKHSVHGQDIAPHKSFHIPHHLNM